jgi:hypothetical protein
VSANSPGRNDPCPCGSGKKFKKCHGRDIPIASKREVTLANEAKSLDGQLFDRIMQFAKLRLGPAWLDDGLTEYMGDDEESMDELELQLAVPWAVFHCPLVDNDVSAARLFAEEKGSHLSPGMQALLTAEFDAWLSVWEVREVEKNVGALMADLLTGEERFVHEIAATASMNIRTAMLARVIDISGISFFSGVHPQPLPPRDANLVVLETRRRCRVRTRPVKPARLRDPEIQLEMIDYWRMAAESLRDRPLPTLTNNEGDLFTFTTDYYDIVTTDRSLLLSRLALIPGAQDPESHGQNKDESSIVVIGHDRSGSAFGETVTGQIQIAGNRMRVECNSARRADSLRVAIETHAGRLVQYRLRQEKNIDDLLREAESRPARSRESTRRGEMPEMQEIAKQIKEQHMAQWPDMEIPALGGLTPREAARDPDSRKNLELLLREMEMMEEHLPEEERFDMTRLRDTLGMPDE